MCGICGFSGSQREQIDARALARHMLLGIEERGRHATGVAWDNDGQTWLDSQAIPASAYVRHLPLDAGTKTFIGHTRWATQGSPQNNDNNHPIDVRGIVGIHNGCIMNDDELFEIIGPEKRIAQVDSEAIFAYLVHSGLDTTEALGHLSGSAAIAWYDVRDPDLLHLARVSSSPLILGETDGGSLLFASTESCLNKSAKAMGLELVSVTSTPEGTYLQVRGGEVVERESFETESRTLTAMERRALNL